MENILIDSSVLISFYDRDDANHQRAINDLDHFNSLGCKLWLIEHVLDEVINILLKRNFKLQLKDFLFLIKQGELELYLPSSPQENRRLVLETFDRVVGQKSEKVSFTDMYQLVLIKSGELQPAKILSYDHHLQ